MARTLFACTIVSSADCLPPPLLGRGVNLVLAVRAAYGTDEREPFF